MIWIYPYKKAILSPTKEETNLTLPNVISVVVPGQKAVCCLSNNYKAILEMVLDMITQNESPEYKKRKKKVGKEKVEKSSMGGCVMRAK